MRLNTGFSVFFYKISFALLAYQVHVMSGLGHCWSYNRFGLKMGSRFVKYKIYTEPLALQRGAEAWNFEAQTTEGIWGPKRRSSWVETWRH